MRKASARRFGPVAAILLLAPSGVAGHTPASSSEEGCAADPLVTCRAEGTVDKKRRALGLDLEVISPGAGLLPGSGRARRTATLKGTRRIRKPVSALELTVTLRVTDAEAVHERPGLGDAVGSGLGTKARIVARLSAAASRCAKVCKDIDEVEVASTKCGPKERSNDDLTLRVFLSNRKDRPIPPGVVRYAISLEGTAAIGTLAVGDPPPADSGIARASANAAIVRVRAWDPSANPSLPEFKHIACFDFGDPPPTNATFTAGAEVVIGHGYLRRRGGWASDFVVAAQAGGMAAGTSGPYVPGWYEVVTGDFFFSIARGSLDQGDMTVSADRTTTTLRVPLGSYGRATLVFSKAGETEPASGMGMSMGYGFGPVSANWQLDADLVLAERAHLTGTAGRYSISGEDPFGWRGEQFAFKAAAGSVRTCTNCPAP